MLLGDPEISSSARPVETVDPTTTPENLSARAMVKLWQDRITKAKLKWHEDFERMRDNMDFVAGLQWPEQSKIRFEKYVVNMTLRAVNQGVATLYAKDPQVSATRRERLDFALWDGNMETIMQATQIQQMGMMHGFPVPPDVTAMLNDYQQGTMRKKVLDKIAKTLEVVCKYELASQQPRFKTQMKQLVRRTHVCGVGYIKVSFCRDYENGLSQSETRVSIVDRAKTAKGIIERLEKGELTEESAEVEQLRSLVGSLGVESVDYEQVKVKEHLVFDFPQATSIIPDPNTRALKGFVGAKWIAEEFYYPIQFVNDFFDLKDKIELGGELKTFGQDKKDDNNQPTSSSDSDKNNTRIRLWEVTNLEDKSKFTICDGHKDFIQAPELVSPSTKGFWNFFAVTFNDIEVEDGCEATIFPPSVVDLMWSAQTQWNEVRQRLARHRRANGPKYLYPDGTISDEDIDRITESEDQEFVKLKTLPPGTDPSKVVIALAVSKIEQELYVTAPLQEDVLLASGQQEANMGPAPANVTATVGTIAEQSRMSVAASDVDGLDDSLSDAMQYSGELLMQEMSSDTVRQIAGPGAVWPDFNKDEFINEISLEVVAASSGRPNKAIDVANWERIAPLIINAGGNPLAVIKESVRRLDDRLDPMEFFPLPVAPMAGPADQNGQTSPAGGSAKKQSGGSDNNKAQGGQPLQPSPGSGVAVPLAGH